MTNSLLGILKELVKMTTELLELRENDESDFDEDENDDICLDEEAQKKEYNKTLKKLEKFNKKNTGKETFVDKDKFNPNEDLNDEDDDQVDDDEVINYI